MSTVGDLLYADVRKSLIRELHQEKGKSAADDAFAAWLLPEVVGRDPAHDGDPLTNKSQSEKNYRYASALGFMVHNGDSGEDERQRLTTSLQWLAGREPFVDGTPMAFCTDAVALLGLALGAKALANQTLLTLIAEWMSSFLPRCSQLMGIHDWQRCVFTAALHTVGSDNVLPLPSAAGVADVRVALRAQGLLPDTENQPNDHDEQEVLSLLKNEPTEGIGLARVALRLAAFDWVRRATPTVLPGRATTQDVITLLKGVSGGLRRWTWENKPRTKRAGAQARKWHIDNEYHVQDLLYFLLAPIFPDLKDEEYFPSIGHKQPRTDLFIPSLNLIIEVKFVYPTTSFQNIIEELGADASLYLAGQSRYNNIVAFIWDDTRRSEHHALLITGLTTITGIRDAIVVSRPGTMKLEV